MSNQATLTEDAPLTLDTTCADRKSKARFPRYATIGMDVSREVKPDIIASATHLPFKEGVFDKIYCDPPHRIRQDDEIQWRRMLGVTHYNRFSHWRKKTDWFEFLDRVNIEFFKVLKSDGEFHIKITDGVSGAVKITDLERLYNFGITKKIRKKSVGFFANLNKKKFGTQSYTLFLTMKPKLVNPEPSEPSALDTNRHSIHEVYQQS